MVKLLTLLLLSFSLLMGGEASLTVEIDPDALIELKPIGCKVKVKYPKGSKLNPESFKVDGQPIKVTLIYEKSNFVPSYSNGRHLEQHQVEALYYFEVEGKMKGTHVLSSVAVEIDDKSYRSAPISYEVFGTESNSSYRLVVDIDVPTTLYPGQRFTVVYRVESRLNIDPRYEYFPLVNNVDFKKIGDRTIRSYFRGDMSVVELSQEMEAEKPGEYRYETSVVEGLPYREDFFGRRIYQKMNLRAEAAPVTFRVLDFPMEGKSTSFQGAVGQFFMHVTLLGPKEVSVGDKMELEVAIGGEELSSVKSLVLAESKGFKGAFRFSDLPPKVKFQGTQKVFIYELRPLSSQLSEIPPVEFSFFNTKKGTYQTIYSPKIPIRVLDIAKETHLDPLEEEAIVPKESREDQKTPTLILGNFALKGVDLVEVPSKSHLLFFILGGAFLAAALTWRMVHKVQQRKLKRQTSKDLFLEAMKNSGESQVFYQLLEKAFLVKLKEKGLIPFVPSHLNDLPQLEKTQEVKNFLMELSETLFYRKVPFESGEWIKRAKKFMKAL